MVSSKIDTGHMIEMFFTSAGFMLASNYRPQRKALYV